MKQDLEKVNSSASDSRRKFLIRGGKMGVGLPLMSSFFSRSAMGAGTCFTASTAHSLAPSTARQPENCIASGRSPGYYKSHVEPKAGDEWNLGWPKYSTVAVYSGAENKIPMTDGSPEPNGLKGSGMITKEAQDWFEGRLANAVPLQSITPLTLLGEINCFSGSGLASLPIMEVLWQHEGTKEFIGIATYFNVVHVLNNPGLNYPIDYDFACELIEAMIAGDDDDYNLPSFAHGSIKDFLDALYV
ncbi:hypothetical protein K6Y31_05060 [Motilimonas cestriensis]|uniref:Uncharacterized protein n=1 Tax=Motilimonas cestriensis TaxID=2742685 RepID=A0ABS8W7D0_9GAMM|nr:hypothetical protein [Motilimonas cestriensis]MCE2594180.1 hypothetical protein [Motilimonas cestriensis]